MTSCITIAHLRPYVTPRFAYSHSEAGGASEHAYSVGGLIGAEYDLGRRFGVFGETGIAYSSATNTFSSTALPNPVDRTTHGFGTTAGVGVIVYF